MNYWPKEAPEHIPALDTAILGLDPLPPKAKAKIEALIDRREDARAAVWSASDAVFEASHALGLLTNRKGFAEQGSAGHRLRPEDDKRLDGEIAAAQAVLDKKRARHDATTERLSKFAFLDLVLEWLSDTRVRRRRLKLAVTPVVTGGNFQNEIERIRGDIAHLDDDWASVEAAPRPVVVAKDALFKEVDQIAERGAPKVDLRRRTGSPIALGDRLQQTVHQGATALSIMGDAGASLFVWLMRDEIKAKLGALIERGDDADALTDDEREKRFGALSARRLELERLEEATIVAADAAGMFIARRADADPRAILEVQEA